MLNTKGVLKDLYDYNKATCQQQSGCTRILSVNDFTNNSQAFGVLSKYVYIILNI